MSNLAEHLMQIVGGPDNTGEPAIDDPDLIGQIRNGLLVSFVHELLKLDYLTTTKMNRVVISRKTLHYRRKLGGLTAILTHALV
jgi:hypothetical protein